MIGDGARLLVHGCSGTELHDMLFYHLEAISNVFVKFETKPIKLKPSRLPHDNNYGIGRYFRIFVRKVPNKKIWGIPNVLTLEQKKIPCDLDH
jgi:hypothetical protein